MVVKKSFPGKHGVWAGPSLQDLEDSDSRREKGFNLPKNKKGSGISFFTRLADIKNGYFHYCWNLYSVYARLHSNLFYLI